MTPSALSRADVYKRQVKPTIEQFEHYQKAARGHIRYVTLATEHDEDFALTRYLTAHGVVVSIGHSGATYEQAYYNTGTAKRFTIKQRIKTGRTGRANRYFKISSWKL